MRRMVDEGFLDMEVLAALPPTKLIEALSILTDDYETWISEQRSRIGVEVVGYDEAAKQAMERCHEILARLREGVSVIESDESARWSFSTRRFSTR